MRQILRPRRKMVARRKNAGAACRRPRRRERDPTTLNRQGHDSGPQYRSAVFYHSDEQRKLAEHYKQKLNESGAFRAPIVTEIAPLGEFYAAEKYHQNYYADNPRQSYCSVVIRPKVDKVKKVFKDKLKSAPQ